MKNLLSNIEIYCINLSKRKDRKGFMESQFKKMGILEKVVFINAIPADILGEPNIVNGLSASESANLLSHLKALNAFVNSDNDFAVIMEDDCNIENAKKFKIPIAESVKKAKIKNICIQLAIAVREENPLVCELKKTSFWDFSNVAYFIDKEYAKLILKNFNTIKKINSYSSVEVFDPRSQKTYEARKTTEVIVYSGNSYSIPILTTKTLGSDMNHLHIEESIRQEITSAEKTNRLWDNKKDLDFFQYLSKTECFAIHNNIKIEERGL
jgi:hypothetical protein